MFYVASMFRIQCFMMQRNVTTSTEICTFMILLMMVNDCYERNCYRIILDFYLFLGVEFSFLLTILAL